jgi:thiamine-phosphate diphosphorylase/hydroxyethylthiazole kinase
MHGSLSHTNHGLDGIAVVSDIVASSNPGQAAQLLKSMFIACKRNSARFNKAAPWSRDEILGKAVNIMDGVRALNPLVHQVSDSRCATDSDLNTLILDNKYRGFKPIGEYYPRFGGESDHGNRA